VRRAAARETGGIPWPQFAGRTESKEHVMKLSSMQIEQALDHVSSRK